MRKRYKASKQVSGKRYWANGWTQEEANQKLAEKLKSLESGSQESTPARSEEVITLVHLAETIWLPTIQYHRESTRRGYMSTFKANIAPYLGNHRYWEIKKADVQNWVNEISKKYAAKTVIRAYSVLKLIMQEAEDNELIERSPCFRIKLPAKPAKRVRYMEVPDVIHLIQVAPDSLKNPLILASFLGLRLGEVLALEWGDISKGIVSISRAYGKFGIGPTKTGDTRSIHLPISIYKMLEQNKTSDTHVCADNAKPFSPSKFNRTLKGWGGLPPGFVFHDLRHVAAYLFSKDPRGSQAILGHASPQMTESYTAITLSHTKSPMETLAKQVESFLGDHAK